MVKVATRTPQSSQCLRHQEIQFLQGAARRQLLQGAARRKSIRSLGVGTLCYVILLFLAVSLNGAAAACVDDPSDLCGLDSYAVPCYPKRASVCCEPCTNDEPPPPVEPGSIICYPPTTGPLQLFRSVPCNRGEPLPIHIHRLLLETADDYSPTLQLPLGCSLSVELVPGTSCLQAATYDATTHILQRKSEPICETAACQLAVTIVGEHCDARCTSLAPKVVEVVFNGIQSAGVSRLHPSPHSPILSSCQEADTLLTDLLTLNGSFVDETISDIPAWLKPSAFQSICTEQALDDGDVQVSYREERMCRNSLTYTVSYQSGVSSKCPLLATPLEEVYAFPAQRPTIVDFIGEEVAQLMVVQCQADLPSGLASGKEEETVDVFVSETSDCSGGHVTVPYLRKTSVSPSPTIENAKELVLEWLPQGDAASSCIEEDERIVHRIVMRDTLAPVVNELADGAGGVVAFFQCLADLPIGNTVPTSSPSSFSKLSLDLLDNCDKAIAIFPTTVLFDAEPDALLGPRPDNCLNWNSGILIYNGSDSSGNQLHLERPFFIRNTVSAVPVDPSLFEQGVVHKHCRQHVRPAEAILVRHECLGEFSVDLSSTTINRLDTGEIVSGFGIEEELEGADVYRHNVEITYLWLIDDNCSDPYYLVQVYRVEDVTGPRWITASMPDEDQVFQCLVDAQAAPFINLTARDECDEEDVEVEPKVAWKYDTKCKDSAQALVNWKARDKSNNVAEHALTVTVRDTQAPQLVENFEEYNRFCIWPANGRYVCFPDFQERILALVEEDNCGGFISVEFASIESYECKGRYDNECTSLAKAAQGTTKNLVLPPNIYYPDSDTVCLRSARLSTDTSRLHLLTFNAMDACRNVQPVPISILVPGPAVNDDSYDPSGDPHPCDHRILLELPHIPNLVVASDFGSLYMVEKIEVKGKATSDAASSFSSLALVIYLVLLSTGLLL